MKTYLDRPEHNEYKENYRRLYCIITCLYYEKKLDIIDKSFTNVINSLSHILGPKHIHILNLTILLKKVKSYHFQHNITGAIMKIS